MANFVSGDAAGAIQHFYANTPHWVMFNADGTRWDYRPQIGSWLIPRMLSLATDTVPFVETSGS